MEGADSESDRSSTSSDLDESLKSTAASRMHKMTDFLNLLKSFIGTQYMIWSYGFSQSGILLGFASIFGVALLTVHCCELIVKCKYYVIEDIIAKLKNESSTNPERRKYGLGQLRRDLQARVNLIDIGHHAWGVTGAVLVRLFLLVTQAGFCVGYQIFIGNLIWTILKDKGGSAWTQLSSDTWLNILVLVPLPFFMVFALFRRLRGIGPISFLANIILVPSFVITITYVCIDFTVAPGIVWFNWSTAAVMLGQAAASYEAVGTLLFIEASMIGNHENFPRYLRMSIAIFTLVFLPLALLGYLHYGALTQQILFLNLPQDAVVIFVELLAVVGVLFTYPIQVFPVTSIMEGLVFGNRPSVQERSPLLEGQDYLEELGVIVSYKVPATTADWKRNVLRVSVCVVIALVAVLFKDAFAYAAALVGALGSTPLAYVMPCALELTLRWYVLPTAVRVKDLVISITCAILSLTMAIVTVYQVVMILK